MLIIGAILAFTAPYLLIIPAIIWYLVTEHKKQSNITKNNIDIEPREQIYTTAYMPYTDYISYLGSTKWEHIRALVLERDSHTCQDCKEEGTTSTLHCHHLTYDRLGDESLTDLVTLCKSCHNIRHS